MKKKYVFLSLGLVALILENVIAIGLGRDYSGTGPSSGRVVITQKNGNSTSIVMDAKTIANTQYKNELNIIALKSMTGDTTVDKVVENQIESSIKSAGSEQNFENSLKIINTDKYKYIEELTYNILYNKALGTMKKSNVSESEALAAIKSGSTQIAKKKLLVYSSINKQALLTIENKLKSENIEDRLKNKIVLNKDTQCGVIDIGEVNKDIWDSIKNLSDGSCLQLVTSGTNNYLVYNVTTIPEQDMLKQAQSSISTQNAVAELNSKINEEYNTFTYKIN